MLWMVNILGKEGRMIVLKATLTYLVLLVLAGIGYALAGKHFTCRGQVIIEKVFTWAVAVLAVGSVVEILYVIWKWL